MNAREHYFSIDPQVAARPRELTVRLDGADLPVRTGAGVFSSGRLDPGTAVLLRAVPAPPAEGDLLDLGCGWGPIAITLARRSPRARVWAVDVNPRAVDLTRINAERLGLTGIRACPPEDVPADVSFAAIWSNPPIRIGKDPLHELLRRWIPRLAPSGTAHLVVQRNLGADSLHRWMAEEFGPRLQVTKAAGAKGYRVLELGQDIR
jgi:16S rRNA G1207 methylase RsmC